MTVKCGDAYYYEITCNYEFRNNMRVKRDVVSMKPYDVLVKSLDTFEKKGMHNVIIYEIPKERYEYLKKRSTGRISIMV